MSVEPDNTWHKLVSWGYLTCWLFPPVGFVIGIVLLNRRMGKPGMGHGVVMMIVAICFAIGYITYFNSQQTDSSSSDSNYQVVPCSQYPEAIGC